MWVLIETCNEGDLIKFREGDLGLVLRSVCNKGLSLKHQVIAFFPTGPKIFYLPTTWEIVLVQRK